MREALTLKGTKPTKTRMMDTAQEDITMLEGQLESLKHNYKGWINMGSWASLPEQHQVIKGDLQMGLDILDLVWDESQSLLMAMEEDFCQTEATETAMI